MSFMVLSNTAAYDLRRNILYLQQELISFIGYDLKPIVFSPKISSNVSANKSRMYKILFLFVLLSQKHNRYHYAGEHQTQSYHEKKKLKRNANPEKSKNITAFFNLHDKTLQ